MREIQSQTLPLFSQESDRKSCRLTILAPQPPWPAARKSKGQETNIWGEDCSGLHFLLLQNVETEEQPLFAKLLSLPPFWGPSTCLTSLPTLFLLVSLGANHLHLPLESTCSQNCGPLLFYVPQVSGAQWVLNRYLLNELVNE